MADGGVDARSAGIGGGKPPEASVCLLIRAETHPGLEHRFQALLTDLAYSIRAEEGDCLSYVTTRPIGTQTHFVVHARFANWRAFERHGATSHLERAMPRLAPLLAAPISLEIFLEV